MVDLFSSEALSWENSSVEAQASNERPISRAYLSEIRVERPPRRRNPDLNKHLHVHRRTKPWPWVHSLPSLNFCRYAVAVLIQRPWPDHVAKRIVAFLALGQLGGDRRLLHEGSSSDRGSKSDGGAERDNPTAESAGGDVPNGDLANFVTLVDALLSDLRSVGLSDGGDASRDDLSTPYVHAQE